MSQPHNIPDSEIDPHLMSGLSPDQKLRVLAVDRAIKHCIGKQLTLKDFTPYFETIYKFYVTTENV